MSNSRCCARCKTPYNCGNPGCACHRSVYADALWEQVAAENNVAAVDARFHMDHYRGTRDPNRDDGSVAGYHPKG